MNLRKQLLFVLMLAGGITAAKSQSLAPVNVMPVTPEVAAIAKYTDIPIGHATGAAMISVPLYNITSGNLSAPLALSYNASGIRVEEGATWVGLGWNLNTGASLVRVVRGIPDDDDNGYMYTVYKVKIIDTMDLETSPISWDIRFGQLDPTVNMDLEPDIFQFSAGGISGKFYYNQDSGAFVLSPYQNVKIAYSTDQGRIKSFTITLPTGAKYYFGKTQDGQRSSYEKMLAQFTTTLSYNVQSTAQAAMSAYITRWSLMEAAEPTGRKLQYYYNEENVTEFGRGGERLRYFAYNDNTATPNTIATFYKTQYVKPVLSKITGEVMDVYFVSSSIPRQDVYGTSYALDSVIIKNKAGLRVKQYYLDYGYFVSPDSTSLWGLYDCAGLARKRLYLKSVTEVGQNGTLPPYRFTYNSTELPDRLSASQDYWGYYNGKNNGLMLLPRIYTGGYTGLPEGVTAGADRRVDTNYTQARMLIRVQYPTGGTTAYTYEANKASILYMNSMDGIERSDLRPRSVHFPRFLWANAPDTLYYTDTFSVSDPATKVKVISTLGNCPAGYQTGDCRFHIIIKGVTNPAFEHHITMTDTYYTTIPEGAYTITAVISPTPAGPVPAFSIDLNWNERTDVYSWMVGGVRVKKIVSTDSVGNAVSRSLGYHFPGNPTLSSGVLAGLPTFCYVPVGIYGNILQKARISNSAVPLTNNGSIVRYQYVTEYQDSAWASMKTEYTFSNDWRDPIKLVGNKAIIPPTQRDWQNGPLLNKKVFEKFGGGYRILSDESTTYKEIADTQFLSGVRYWLTPVDAKMLTSYYVASQRFIPDSSITTFYSYVGNQVATKIQSVKNVYNDHFDIANVKTANSKGQVVESKTWFPYDFDDVPNFFIPQLLQNGITNLPIKQEVTVRGKLISGTISQYDPSGLPFQTYIYENAMLTDTTSHSRTSLPMGSYKLRRTYSYDLNRLVLMVEPGIQAVSYLWDYDQNFYPSAEIRNSRADRYAYTSFEMQSTGNNGNWTIPSAARNTQFAITGGSCYDMANGNITANTLTTTTYLVSYWTRNLSAFNVSGTQGSPVRGRIVNGWTYYKHFVSGVLQVVVSGTGYIDDIRLLPAEGTMTTRTYNPAGNVTSSGNERGDVAGYEYDGFNRLIRVRDAEGRILKQYEYAQQSAVRFTSVAASVSRARDNCTVGGTPSTVIFTIPAGQYVSNFSQADADEQAVNAANAGAQAYANTNGTCTWYNVEKSGTYTRTTCGSGYTGGTYIYTVAAGTYSSTQSQTVADGLAQTDVTNNGQTAANTYGPCVSACSPACNVPAQKCINGVCRRGLQVTTSCVPYGGGQYVWTFHYEYPDGTWSGNLAQITDTPCN